MAQSETTLKIKNFLGYEELTDIEKKEIKNIKREIIKGIFKFSRLCLKNEYVFRN
jgi:hypothetical protein